MKKRNLFMSTTLICGFFCVAFTFDESGIHWLWADTTPVAIILVITTMILGVFWFKTSKKLNFESRK